MENRGDKGAVSPGGGGGGRHSLERRDPLARTVRVLFETFEWLPCERVLGHSQRHLTFRPLQAPTPVEGMAIAAEGSTAEVPSSAPSPASRGARSRRLRNRVKGLKFGPRSQVPAAYPFGSGWSGGVGRCLPQGQTPLGEGCWFRPVPADWPGVGAVRTLSGGYLPAERKGLGACLPPKSRSSGFFRLLCCTHPMVEL